MFQLRRWPLTPCHDEHADAGGLELSHVRLYLGHRGGRGVHVCLYTCTDADDHIYAQTHILTHIHSHADTHTRTIHMHTLVYAHTHTHTQLHSHTPNPKARPHAMVQYLWFRARSNLPHLCHDCCRARAEDRNYGERSGRVSECVSECYARVCMCATARDQGED